MAEDRLIPELATRMLWALTCAAYVDRTRAIEIFHQLRAGLSNAEDIIRSLQALGRGLSLN